MPVYLNIFNLIIKKDTISEKYIGGLEKFRKDYQIDNSEINQEDDELFALGAMNSDEFDIEDLILNGLSFDNNNQSFNDFTIIYRYDNSLSEVNWLQHNRVFAWHVDTSNISLALVNQISEMFMDKIEELIENGENPLKTIRL